MKKIILLKTICHKLNTYIYNYFNRNKTLHEQLITIKYNYNYNIKNEKEKFKRKNKQYEKNFYFFLTIEMKNNLKNKDDIISQWFIDTTYYAIPRNYNSFNLLLILGFNKRGNIIEIDSIVLIKNKNQETFIKIFTYLNTKYNFKPDIINIDCCVAEIIAIKKKH